MIARYLDFVCQPGMWPFALLPVCCITALWGWGCQRAINWLWPVPPDLSDSTSTPSDREEERYYYAFIKCQEELRRQRMCTPGSVVRFQGREK